MPYLNRIKLAITNVKEIGISVDEHEDVESLDLRDEPLNTDSESEFEKRYQLREKEDSGRRTIAYILLGLLGSTLVWAYITTWICPNSKEDIIDIL